MFQAVCASIALGVVAELGIRYHCSEYSVSSGGTLWM